MFVLSNVPFALDATTLLLVVLPGVTLLFVLCLVVRGVRGRRGGDHPYCRRCGFDLFGLPPTQARCPECGRDLLARPAKSVVIGRRKKRVRLLVTGLALLFPAAAVLAATTLGVVKAADINRRKPTWWLLLDLTSANPGVPGPAAVELRARLNDGRLDPAGFRQTVERILKIQAERARPWSPEFGDFIEDARNAGLLAPHVWNTFVAQGVDGSIEVNPVVRRDARFPVRMVFAPARLGTRTSVHLNWECIVCEMGGNRVEHTSKDTGEIMGFSLPNFPGKGTTEEHFIYESDWRELTEGLGDGPHPLRLSVAVAADIGWAVVARRTLEWSGTVTVAPEAARTIRLVKDPQVRERLKRSVKARFAKPPPWSGRDDPYMLRLRVDKPPVPLAGFIVFRADGGESWNWVLLATDKHPQHDFAVPREVLANFSHDKVSAAFRPDPHVAADEIDITEIWGEELELVPVGSELGPKEP